MPVKKVILHVSKYYYPYLGGIETLVKSIAEGMTEYRHVVVCFASNGENSNDIVNGITVHRVKVNFSIKSQGDKVFAANTFMYTALTHTFTQ